MTLTAADGTPLAPTPLTAARASAAFRQQLGGAFEHPRLPDLRLRPTADGDISVHLKNGAGEEVAATLSPMQARSLASALYAFAELIEPKHQPRGSGWRPA